MTYRCIDCGEEMFPYQKHDCPEKPVDMVNHPPHYASGKIECIEAIEVATEGLNGFEGMLTGNTIKYLWRWKRKNGVEDLRKARWYLDRLITLLEGSGPDAKT